MKKRMTVAGVALLGVCLAGWAALAWGQASIRQPLLAINSQPAAPTASEPTPLFNLDQPPQTAGTILVSTPPVPPVPSALAAQYPPAATSRPAPTVTPSAPMMPPPLPAEAPLPRVPASGQAAPAWQPLPLPLPPAVPQSAPTAPLVGMPPPGPEVIPLSPVHPQHPPGAPMLVPQPAMASQPIQQVQQVQPAPQGLAPLPGQPVQPVQPTPQLKPVPTTVEEVKPVDVPLTPEGPMGRQEPAVSMEWVGPPVIKVGQSQDYALTLRNACNIPVQEVLVRMTLPASMKSEGAEPKAEMENNVFVWRVGAMMPRQEKTIQMKLNAEARGDFTPKAWVTFTGLSILHLKVREPKLVLKATTQDKVMVGDPAAVTLTVTNPGDGSAEQVKVHALLSDGLDHGRDNKVDFDIGNLAPGETRSVQLICGTRAGGVQKCECTATAEGGLTAQDTGLVNVIMPRLDLQVIGPGMRYLDRKAQYTLKITNPGDAPATNVTVGDVVPAGFKVLAASDGGRHDFNTRTVSWFLGEIGPGQTREVKFEAQAVEPGEHKNKASAVGARGLRAESELTTRVEGLSALMLELVDNEDLIEVGAETTYEVRVTNSGSKTETDVKLVAVLPDKMEFKGVEGPVRYREEGKTIVFDPIDKLAPRADAFFKMKVKALEPGMVRFKVQVNSANLSEPVIKMQSTRIYADTPEGKPQP